MRDVRADAADHAGAFMAEQQRPAEAVIVHLVQLRMTHAAGIKLYGDLVGTGIGQLQFFDQELSTNLGMDRGLGFHRTGSLLFLVGSCGWKNSCVSSGSSPDITGRRIPPATSASGGARPRLRMPGPASLPRALPIRSSEWLIAPS